MIVLVSKLKLSKQAHNQWKNGGGGNKKRNGHQEGGNYTNGRIFSKGMGDKGIKGFQRSSPIHLDNGRKIGRREGVSYPNKTRGGVKPLFKRRKRVKLAPPYIAESVKLPSTGRKGGVKISQCLNRRRRRPLVLWRNKSLKSLHLDIAREVLLSLGPR